MENTVNYNLKKPGQDDFYNVADFNSNADIIDGALKTHDTQLAQIDIDITDLLNNKSIHSSGSNANGFWIRFQDGTQLCYQSTLLVSLNILSGAVYNSPAFSFPAAFINPDAIVLSYSGTCFDAGQNTLGVALTDSRVSYGAPQEWRFQLKNISNLTIAIIARISLMAIGRWK